MCVCDWVKSQADGQFLDGVPLKRFAEMIRFRERHSSSYCCASFFCFWHISSLVPLCSLKETFSQDLILMVLFVCFIPCICHKEKATLLHGLYKQYGAFMV